MRQETYRITITVIGVGDRRISHWSVLGISDSLLDHFDKFICINCVVEAMSWLALAITLCDPTPPASL